MIRALFHLDRFLVSCCLSWPMLPLCAHNSPSLRLNERRQGGNNPTNHLKAIVPSMYLIMWTLDPRTMLSHPYVYNVYNVTCYGRRHTVIYSRWRSNIYIKDTLWLMSVDSFFFLFSWKRYNFCPPTLIYLLGDWVALHIGRDYSMHATSWCIRLVYWPWKSQI